LANLACVWTMYYIVVLEQKSDGIYCRRYNPVNGQQCKFSDNSYEKRVIPYSSEFDAVQDGFTIIVYLASEPGYSGETATLYVSYDMGETFERRPRE